MRIQWWSNAPWCATGYGTQTAQVCRRLTADGHTLSISANHGLGGARSTWEGITVYPHGMDAYSQDVITSHWQHYSEQSTDPTLLLTLFDTWILKDPGLADIPLIASWVPIDHLPTPPEVLGWCTRPNVVPIAMSKFGAEMLLSAGVDNMYVPHAVDTAVFKPGDRNNGRQLMEIDDDKFVVMMNANNKGVAPIRKGFGEAFQAFKVFSEQHRDAVLYIHSEDGPGGGGIDLQTLARACQIPADRIRFVNAYAYRSGIPQELLADVYTAADVLLAPSLGEGFGIPVIEAQACGTPVVVSDWTAQPELVGDGWTVPVQPTWDAALAAWFGTPLVPAIHEGLTQAYKRDRGTSTEAVEFAAAYDADFVYREHWQPVLERLADKLTPPAVRAAAAKRERRAAKRTAA